MEIKILCDCGVKFKFDVEPVNGRSPGPVHCPGCGKDQTPATDERITAFFAEAARMNAVEPAMAGPKRITLVGGPVAAMPAAPAKAAAAPAAAPGHTVPKMAVMPVPSTTKTLSVKPPGEYREEAELPASAAAAAGSEPKGAGAPKMAYMPVPETKTALKVKLPTGDE